MTEHKQTLFWMSVNKRGIKPLIGLLLIGLMVGGCSSKRVIQTVDDSADYKSARALPPLKKPSRVLATAESEPASAPTSAEPATAVQAADDTPAADPTVATREEDPTPTAELEPEPQVTAEPTEPVVLTARVINDEGDNAVLEIDAEYETAWEFLTESLQKSDVTVFARNRDAGRFSIGCGGVAEDAVVVQKKGGWSFFSRAKSEDLEYCALQAIERKGKTVVSVVNRAGVIVPAENSEALFARILNN